MAYLLALLLIDSANEMCHKTYKGGGNMEWLQQGKWCLLFFVFAVLAFVLLCLVLGIFGYKLHISAKKIEILPAKESPKQKH